MKKQKSTAAITANEPITPAQRIRADWKLIMQKLSYKQVLTNIPYLSFVALLAMIYIGNSHRAVEIQRELNKKQQELKELRWRYMDIKTQLMNAGMETQIIQSGAPYGLKPLSLPPYSIEITH